jgi:hypothetical protein
MYRPDMDSFSSLFKALGGPDEVARKLNLTSDAVYKMAQRHSVRPKHWAPLVELARDRKVRGVTLDSLARIATTKADA